VGKIQRSDDDGCEDADNPVGGAHVFFHNSSFFTRESIAPATRHP
jgi:hypothetical protein